MARPLVTIGMPVYHGQDMVAVTLECLRTQTYPNLDVRISVDGADQGTVEACRPFLSDPRFRLHVQPVRLGWAGNLDFTMQECKGEFFIFQQHDDQVSPTYVADLVEAAERWPQASICYSEMEVSGQSNFIARDDPILGDPIARALAHMELFRTSMFRGLIRSSALDQSDGLLDDEFEGFSTFHRLMAELALAGEFRFVEGPTYYKRIHGKNLHLKWYDWPEERKRAAWAVLAAAMIEVIVPPGPTVAFRLDVLNAILERFLFLRDGRWIFCQVENSDAAARGDLLRMIIDAVRSRGRFDAVAHLEMPWSAMEQLAHSRWDCPEHSAT